MNKFNKVILIFTLSLAGCATEAERQQNNTVNILDYANKELTSCYRAAYFNPDNSAYKKHLPKKSASPTIDEMTDKTKATPEEIRAIKNIQPQFAACQHAYIVKANSVAPAVANAYSLGEQEQDQLRIDLVSHKITWGEYITKWRKVTQQTMANIDGEFAKINTSFQQSYRYEQARRDAAFDSLQRTIQTQQLINAVNKPVYTNCTGGYGSVNCVSQ